MQNKNNAGLRFSQKAVWRCILGVIIVLFGVFVYQLNQVDKTELVVRTGQTFEKAEVTEILQDNLEDNVTRVGEQKVRVRMLTGCLLYTSLAVRQNEQIALAVVENRTIRQILRIDEGDGLSVRFKETFQVLYIRRGLLVRRQQGGIVQNVYPSRGRCGNKRQFAPLECRQQ